MDYEAKGEDELSLKEGDKIRVYKKYCHWSYRYVGTDRLGKLAFFIADRHVGPKAYCKIPVREAGCQLGLSVN